MRLANSKRIVVTLRVVPLLCLLLAVLTETRAERLPIKTYTTADGLARDHVNRIVQDSKGFLWFCTSEGLSRFDGYKFTNYGTEDGLAGRVVLDFLEARNGFYWVATDKGLCRFIPDALPQTTAGVPGGVSTRCPGGQTVRLNGFVQGVDAARWVARISCRSICRDERGGGTASRGASARRVSSTGKKSGRRILLEPDWRKSFASAPFAGCYGTSVNGISSAGWLGIGTVGGGECIRPASVRS